ncbi:MAG: hypothetical protein ACLR5S_05095 [Ruminococcus sp.]
MPSLPAQQILGVENRVGSIAPGMDADIQLYHGDPLDLLCDRGWC